MEHRDQLGFTILKFLFTNKTRSWLNILVWRVGAGQDATRFTIICFVKQEDFYATKELRSR